MKSRWDARKGENTVIAARNTYQTHERARMHNRAATEVDSLTDAGMARFENWHAWAAGGETAMVMRHSYPRQVAACALYRSTEHYTDDEAPQLPIDKEDALKVDRAICLLPNHLKTAVTNKYMHRPDIRNVPYDVLDGWVKQAARMLMERWP
jgi:hypothetical protein